MFEGIMDAVAEKAKEVLTRRILQGGELVSDEQAAERLNRCKTLENGIPCRYFGPVSVAGLIFPEGCNACGCPAATKFRMKNITDPLTRAAITAAGGDPEIDCKHPDGSKWIDIEQKYKH